MKNNFHSVSCALRHNGAVCTCGLVVPVVYLPTPYTLLCPKCGETMGVVTGSGKKKGVSVRNILILKGDIRCQNCSHEMHIEFRKT